MNLDDNNNDKSQDSNNEGSDSMGDVEEIPTRILDLLVPDFVEENINNLRREEIKNYEPACIKGIGTVYAFRLGKIGIKTIEDLSKQSDPNDIMDQLGIEEFVVLRWLLASDIITSYSLGGEDFRPVVVAGLRESGKSSLVLTLKNMETSIAPIPTKGIHKEEITFLDVAVPFVELGGEKEQRENYLKKPKDYFKDIMMLIYVVDVTKPTKMKETLDYLRDLVETIIAIGERPNLRVLLHKYDPAYRHQHDSVVRHVSLSLDEMFKKEFNLPNKEMYRTSVFEIPSIVTAFSGMFSDLTPISKIMASVYLDGSSTTNIFAGFIFNEKGFVISEWTKRLPKERRDRLFDEIYTFINEKGSDPELYRHVFQTSYTGIHVVLERLDIEGAKLFLASVNTTTDGLGAIQLKTLREKLKPWVKNFFAVGNKRFLKTAI